MDLSRFSGKLNFLSWRFTSGEFISTAGTRDLRYGEKVVNFGSSGLRLPLGVIMGVVVGFLKYRGVLTPGLARTSWMWPFESATTMRFCEN